MIFKKGKHEMRRIKGKKIKHIKLRREKGSKKYKINKKNQA